MDLLNVFGQAWVRGKLFQSGRRLIRIYTFSHFVFDFRQKPLFASVACPKFSDGRFYFRNSDVGVGGGSKGLTDNVHQMTNVKRIRNNFFV